MTKGKTRVYSGIAMTRLILVVLVLLGGTSLWSTAMGEENIFEKTTNRNITYIGSETTQGDAVMNADDARSDFGVNGAGIRIGVISDSFNGAGSSPTVSSQITNGDLPGVGNPNGYTTPVTVVHDDTYNDEGRAMLEIVHDVAPGAELYFHSAFNNSLSGGPSSTIAAAINNLVAAGCNVIVDDVGILGEARFQDGTAAQAVNAARSAGIAYFSSAGNSGHNATRAQHNGGLSSTVNWGTNDVLEVSFTGSARLVVQWTDTYQSVTGSDSVTDFAVDITDVTGGTTYLTIDDEHSDAYEFVGISGPSGNYGIRVRVAGASGDSSDMVQVTTYSGFDIIDADDTDSPTVHGHAAAEGGVAVAAHRWSDPNSTEYFSSYGPTDIFFDENGDSVSVSRSTPLLTAPDGVSTTTDGFEAFYGTSAAAPHAAAVAALMLERANDLGLSLTVDDLYNLMYASAVDIESTGFDNMSGWGRLDAYAAVGAVPEPGTMGVLLIGGVMVLLKKRRAGNA